MLEVAFDPGLDELLEAVTGVAVESAAGDDEESLLPLSSLPLLGLVVLEVDPELAAGVVSGLDETLEAGASGTSTLVVLSPDGPGAISSDVGVVSFKTNVQPGIFPIIAFIISALASTTCSVVTFSQLPVLGMQRGLLSITWLDDVPDRASVQERVYPGSVAMNEPGSAVQAFS